MNDWWLRLRDRPKLVQALRMTVSSLTAFALAQALELPQGFWAIITALIVTQSNLGGSLKAALDRFVGSVFGALYGGAVALAIPHEHLPARAAALVVAVAPLSFLAAFSPGFRIAPITAIIVLLSATGTSLGPVSFALDRILEIGLGCAVGLLVSVLIVPARATRLVLDTAAQVARLLAEQLDTLAKPGDQAQVELVSLARNARQALARLETLVGEAARERRSRLVDSPDPEPLARTLNRLRHDVIMVRRALREPGHELLREHVTQPWSHAARTAAAVLRELGRTLSGEGAPQTGDFMPATASDYRAALEDIRQVELNGPLPPEAASRLFGAKYALEQLRRDLDDLAERTQEFAGRPGEEAG